MNDLTKLNNNYLTLESREVAGMVTKQHSELLKDIRRYSEYLNEGNLHLVDFFTKSSYKDTKGEKRPCYEITIKGCEFIAHKLTGQKGAIFTATYINKFHDMEQHKYSYMIEDPIERAEAWIKEQEEKQILLAENKKNIPKVIFADSVATSKATILIGDLAKILKQNGIETGAKRLFAWLRKNGYLIKRKGADYNSPTQKSMESGLFEIKETSITHSDGHITVNKTTKVTGKDQIYFINKFNYGDI